MLNVGKYQENNLVGVKTQPMEPYASSSNNNINASLTTPTIYNQMLPLVFPSAPQEQTGHRSIDLLIPPSQIDSIKNFSLNDVSLKGHTSGFPNPSIGTIFHDPKNLPSYPNGANSLYPNHQRNKSSDFHYLKPHPRVIVNNSHGVKDVAKPSLLPPNQIQKLDLLSYKGVARERAMKRPLREFQEFDIMTSASKRPRMNFTPLNYYEGVQSRMEKIFPFKDENNQVSTFKIKTDAKENIDKDNLDLSLHL